MKVALRVAWFRAVMLLAPVIPGRLMPWWLGLALLSWPRLVPRESKP